MDTPIELLLQSVEWSPLRDFYGAWYRVPLSRDTGVSSAELDEAERRRGRTMPMAVRDWLRLVGRHEALLDETAQDYEMPMARMGECPRWWLLFGENQEGWHCGVLDEHITMPNPPVYFRASSFDLVRDAGFDAAELVDGAFVRVADTVSAFVLAMAMRQVVIRCEASDFLRSGVSGASCTRCDVASIRRAWMLRRMLAFPAGYDPEYSDHGIIFVHDWGFAARTPAIFDTMALAVKSGGGSLLHRWHTR